MGKTKEIIVGALFFGTLFTLGYLTFLLTDFTLFRTTYEYEIFFDQANNLKIKDNVLIMGTEQGKVEAIEFFEEPLWSDRYSTELWVMVTVRLDHPLTLMADYEMSIQNANLLGGKVLGIYIGTSDKRIDPKGVRLVGLAVQDPIEAISKFIEHNKGPVKNTLRNIDNLVSNINEWSNWITDGKGTLGRLVKSESMAQEVEEILGGISRFAQDLNRDDNLLAMLTKDPASRERIDRALEDLRTVLGDLSQGRGTLGKLIRNPEIHDELLSVMSDVKTVTGRIREGEGMIGKLLSPESEEAFEDFRAFLAAAREFSTEAVEVVRFIQAGEGPLGKLLADEELGRRVELLFGKADKLLDAALGSIEDAREAAPLVSLGSFLFGAL